MIPLQLFVDGKPMRLGDRIGKGGEGEVFALADGTSRAIKFYTVPDVAQRESKISAMVRLRLAEQSTLVAFPLAVVRNRNGAFAGFVMNLVSEHKPLFELYAPGARKQNFPEADYRFLVCAAVNTARAVASVHKAGCVIGDINHSGVLISKKATVALIDADSFQLIDGNQRHLCRVGVPEYTPPELQGLNLNSVVRTSNHDAFGLAIAIFQLLAMGRHPYVGAYVNGDLPLHSAIAEHRFAYSKQRDVGMTAPPGACTLDDFPRPLSSAFEAAFSPTHLHKRPTAAQWVGLLDEYERSLRVCATTKLHHYSTAAPGCPWCRMESRLGVVLFVPTFATYAGSAPAFDPVSTGFDLSRLWAHIESIRIPARSQLKPILPQFASQPSPEAHASKNCRDGLKAAAYLCFAVAIGTFLGGPQLFALSIGLIILGFVLYNRNDDISSSLRQRYLAAESQWDAAVKDWERRCGIDKIESIKPSLATARASLQVLPSIQAERVAEYQTDRRVRQLTSYLDGFHIRNVKIVGIGPAKQATLASYGIETAADVDRARVLAVPGFGPTNSLPLFEWRERFVKRFTYDPQPNATDHAAIGKIHAEIAQQAAQLRQKLTSGAQELWQAAQASDRMLKTADPVLSRIEETRSQIRADFAYLGLPLPPRPAPVRQYTSPPRPTSSAPVNTIRTAPTTGRTYGPMIPSCPSCGSSMVKRWARRGRRRQRQFWGCARYPRCTGTRSI